MTVEKNAITGAWQISDILNGHLVRRTYYGHTKREAIKAWKEEFK